MAIRKPFAVLPAKIGNITTGNEKANRPASHLALAQFPGMIWESDGSGSLFVRGQFSAVETINFVSVMGATAQPGTTVRVRLGSTQSQVDGSAPYDSGVQTFIDPSRVEASGKYHSHLEIPASGTAIWWRIDIGGHTGDFSASAIIFGEKREPSNFYNRDREIGFEDLGSLEIARNGVVADTTGQVLKTLLFRLQWAEDEEFFSQWADMGGRDADGRKRLVYWCFDPEPDAYRQAKSFLGFMRNDIFMRGNKFPKANEIDFQFRAIL